MQKEKKPIISYHTFVFPFLWDDSGKVTRTQFEDKLITGTHWKQEILDTKATPSPALYSQQQYFNHAAKSVMFSYKNDPDAPVRNFRYDFGAMAGIPNWLDTAKDSENPLRLVLEKGDFRASLRVNGLRLKLYNTGVGLLVYELENYDLHGEMDIIRINEFGRRLFRPYTTPAGCKECADRITLQVKDFVKLSASIDGGELPGIDTVPLPETVLYFLRGEKHSATANPDHGNNQLFIEPIIDDRMFTLCYYINQDFVADMAKWDEENGCYQYLTDARTRPTSDPENLARRLHRLLLIDSGIFTCQSRSLLSRLLTESLYTRWLENTDESGSGACWGTLTGITASTMICVSTGTFVADTAFLIEYVEMALLVLAQRASLLNFEKRISESARNELSVENIQKRYVLFHGQMLLREVSPQIQAIELYDMLQEKLMIQREAQEIESQLTAMFTLEQNIQEKNESRLLNVLAVSSVFEVCAFLSGAPGAGWIAGAIAAALAVVLLLLLLNRKRHMK